MEQFHIISLVNRQRGDKGLAYVPPEVFRDTVWEYLTYPHERRGKHVITYNKCLLELPKPRIYPGPRIIHGFAGFRDLTLIKFIYTIHHGKDPSSYITIHEYVTMRMRPTGCQRHHNLRHNRIKRLRLQYMERICE